MFNVFLEKKKICVKEEIPIIDLFVSTRKIIETSSNYDLQI
jgi:hypothetical protein